LVGGVVGGGGGGGGGGGVLWFGLLGGSFKPCVGGSGRRKGKGTYFFSEFTRWVNLKIRPASYPRA